MSKMSRYPAFSLLFGWSVLIFGCASPQLSDSQYSRNGKNNDCNMQTKDEVFFVDGGTVDRRYTYTYDTNGNVLTEEVDYDADGTVDKLNSWTYTYDSDGNMLSEERDYGADGTGAERHTYTYDANGNMLSEEVDHDADGTVDKLKSWTYTYDSDGNMLSAEFYGADGTLSSSYTYTWSCE